MDYRNLHSGLFCAFLKLLPYFTSTPSKFTFDRFARSFADLGISIDLKSADKELKVVMPEKSKAFDTAFAKKLVITFQLSKTQSGHISLK